MAKLLSLGKGYRTFFFCLLIALIAVGKYLGYIDESLERLLLGLSGAGGLAALRAAK